MKKPNIKFNLKNIKIPQVKIYGIDVIKNFLFFTLFIVLTLLAIGLIIAPSIKIFKQNQNEYYTTKTSFENTKNRYLQKSTELKKLKKQNRKIILAFKRDFNQKNFILFASKYMDIKNIKEINSSIYKKDFIRTSYLIKAVIQTPQNFYDFIDALKNYKYIIRAYFPVDFEKKNKIILTFKIEQYRTRK